MTTNMSPCPIHPESPADLSDHIGGKACTVAPARKARGLYDLPIFGAFWQADGRDLNA